MTSTATTSTVIDGEESEPRVLGGLVTTFTVLAAVVVAVLLMNRPLVAEVEGNYERTNELDVLAMVEPYLGSGLFGVDLAEVRTRVQGLPWVDRARVQRRWPNKLLVIVSEHIVAARWGDRGLLNTRGEIFISDARHIPPELPLLRGPDGSEWQVAQRYLEIRGQLIQTGLGLSAITLSPRGAWRVTLANDIEVRFGREQFANRLERFIYFAAPLVLKNENKISYIDLRYGNGFAVGWDVQTQTTDKQGVNSDV